MVWLRLYRKNASQTTINFNSEAAPALKLSVAFNDHRRIIDWNTNENHTHLNTDRFHLIHKK